MTEECESAEIPDLGEGGGDCSCVATMLSKPNLSNFQPDSSLETAATGLAAVFTHALWKEAMQEGTRHCTALCRGVLKRLQLQAGAL